VTPLVGLKALFSRATLLSAVVSLLVFGVASNFRFAACLVALLYMHELGHIFAAMTVKVPVRRPPFFIPGLGAFVLLDENIRAWDRVIVSFGGPVVGGIAALVLKLAAPPGWRSFAAPAAQFALTINLFNLMPFKPLDGGHIAAATGAISFLPALLLGLVLFFRIPGLLVKMIVAVGLVAIYQASNQEPEMGWLPRLGVFVMHLITLALMVFAFAVGGMPAFDDQLKPSSLVWRVPELLVPVVLLAMAGPYAARRATKMNNRVARVALLAFAALPAYLLTKPIMIPAWFGLLGIAIGLDVRQWLARYALRVAGKDPLAAGMTAAWAYDVLEARGDDEGAERLLQEVLGQAGNLGVTAAAYSTLYILGQHDRALASVGQMDAPFELPPGTDPVVKNNLAWMLYLSGRPDAGLPLARSAVEKDPRNPALLDTLGRILEALEQYEEAEQALRKSLATGSDSYTRVALARALAGRGFYREAVSEGEAALAGTKGKQRDGEPAPEVVRGWIGEWREKAEGAGQGPSRGDD
jgi:Zn-dependent protease